VAAVQKVIRKSGFFLLVFDKSTEANISVKNNSLAMQSLQDLRDEKKKISFLPWL
jgi:hypothetical protein